MSTASQNRVDISLNKKLLWLVYLLLLVLSAVLTYQSIVLLQRGVSIKTDMQALLPSYDDPLIKNVSELLKKQFADITILLVMSDSIDALDLATNNIKKRVAKSEYADLVGVEEKLAEFGALTDYYIDHNQYLLSDRHQNLLSNNGLDELVAAAWQKLLGFQPASTFSEFAKDPLGIIDEYIYSLPMISGSESTGISGAVIHQDAGGSQRYSSIVVVEVKGGAFAIDSQRNFVEFVDHMQTDVTDKFLNVKIYRSGIVFHAEHAASQAKREFGLISVCSILAIFLLFYFSFKSPLPLVLSLLTILFGFASATVLSISLFGEIHIITLVFGASLIGVVVDYSLHYFSSYCALQEAGSRGQAAIAKIFPSILMGLVTTAAGYACLYQSAMSSLKEIASFCLIGLFSAWLLVVALLPLIVLKNIRMGETVQRIAALTERFWLRLGKAGSVALILLLGAGGVLCVLFLAESINDARILYKPAKHLLEQDQKVSEYIAASSANQYFLLSADDPESLLMLNESVDVQLAELVREEKLSKYTAISHYVPSQQKQQSNYQLKSEALFAENSQFHSFLESVGFDQAAIDKLHKNFYAAKGDYLNIDEWLELAPSYLSFLWLGNSNNGFSSIITLEGIKDIDSLKSVANRIDGVRFLNQVTALSNHLHSQFNQAVRFLALAYVLVGVLLFVRYRRLIALRVLAVPLFASITTIGVLSLYGIELGLFHILALYLALGLGLDYGIFLYDGNSAIDSKTAVTMSALTSSLSFGLLSFSSMPMISSFGMTILTSGLISLFVAPFFVGHRLSFEVV